MEFYHHVLRLRIAVVDRSVNDHHQPAAYYAQSTARRCIPIFSSFIGRSEPTFFERMKRARCIFHRKIAKRERKGNCVKRVAENPTHLVARFSHSKTNLKQAASSTACDNHLSNQSLHVVYTSVCSKRERAVAEIGELTSFADAVSRVPMNRVDDVLRVNGGRETRTRTVWPSTGCTYVNRRWIGDWKKPLENPLSAVSPWSSWGKQIWRCYHWSCDGSTSLLPYRTRKSILLLPTNTRWGGFSSKRALSLSLSPFARYFQERAIEVCTCV